MRRHPFEITDKGIIVKKESMEVPREVR